MREEHPLQWCCFYQRWLRPIAIAELEEHCIVLLAGQQHIVAFHVKPDKHGISREHCHVVWSKIDAENMKAIHMAHALAEFWVPRYLTDVHDRMSELGFLCRKHSARVEQPPWLAPAGLAHPGGGAQRSGLGQALEKRPH
jgi:hypothetical protein